MFNPRRLVQLSILITLFALVAGPVQAQPLNDPMRPPMTVSPSTSAQGSSKAIKRSQGNGYQLSAIRITKQQRSATINGKTLHIGSHIGTARVTAIQASSVTLQRAGKKITVPLLPLSIKKPVEANQP